LDSVALAEVGRHVSFSYGTPRAPPSGGAFVRGDARCGHGLRRPELTDALGSQIGVPLELVPRFVQREVRDLADLISALKELAGSLVAQVVKAQVLDAEHVARAARLRTIAV
jgi:hypothetical protein